MNVYPEQDLVKKCLIQIEEKLGWGSSELWHNQVFQELSETIQQDTKIMLSQTTLKRVWGKVNYDSAPSTSTLNTLAQFAGYINWRDFRTKTLDYPSVQKNNQRKKSYKFALIVSTLILLAISSLVLLFSMIGAEKTTVANSSFSNIKFSSHAVAEGLPNSVVFDFDLHDLFSDSIFIQQYWDATKTIRITPKQHQATGIYYYPGYFRAKLLVDGNIIKEHDLFIKTKEWIATVDYTPVPKYIQQEEILKSSLRLPEIIEEEAKKNDEPINTTFHMIKDFGNISGDNFSLTTTIKNTYNDKWAVCQTTRIILIGKKGAIIIPFSIPGCVSDLGLLLNDVYKSGKKHDLSAFGTDFSEFRTVGIDVVNKHIRVSIDKNQIFNDRYKDSMGDFVGIRYKFLGTGEIAHLKVTDHKTQTYFEENFR